MKDQLLQRTWRVRMKYSPKEIDFSSEAWKRAEVGIWYGAWSVDDLGTAIRSGGSIEDHLNCVPAQQELGKEAQITKTTLDTITRFFGKQFFVNADNDVMLENDWVVVCSNDSNQKTIHLGRLKGEPKDDSNHELNKSPHDNAPKELWKFREVIDRKSFPLSALPDFYRLIPQYGRQGNIFQFRGNYLKAVNILARCGTVTEVQNEFRTMDDNQRLDLMGPEVWEAMCLGYLIRMKNFVPTGVSAGGTLKDFDMAGCNWKDGVKIYAQCKKDQDPKEVEEGFYAAADDVKRVTPNAKIYYFPYGNCLTSPPARVVDEIINLKSMQDWFRTEEGEKYLKLFWAC